MATYSVHEKPSVALDPVSDVMFVKTGFSAAAIIFGGFWFVWHRMWLPLAGYLIVLTLLVIAAFVSGLHPAGMMMAQSLVALLLGFQAAAIRRWSVGRGGFREVAITSGRTLDDAEMRFFAWRGISMSEQSDVPAARPKLQTSPDVGV